MFCPNCAAPNADDHSFCRRCGLKLDAIAKAVAEQFPSIEYATLARRIRAFEIVGAFSLSCTGLAGLAMILVGAFYNKLLELGLAPNILFYGAFAAFVIFGLFSVFCFNYKQFVDLEKVNPRLPAPGANNEEIQTSKLLVDPPFEPASVVDRTTERLGRK